MSEGYKVADSMKLTRRDEQRILFQWTALVFCLFYGMALVHELLPHNSSLANVEHRSQSSCAFCILLSTAALAVAVVTLAHVLRTDFVLFSLHTVFMPKVRLGSAWSLRGPPILSLFPL